MKKSNKKVKGKTKKKKPLMHKLTKIFAKKIAKKKPKAVKKIKTKVRAKKKLVAAPKKTKKTTAARKAIVSTKKVKTAVAAKPSLSPMVVVAIRTKPKIKPIKNVTAISGPMGVEPYKSATKNEVYMCPRQIEYFKIILNTWKEQLMDEMSRTVQHMKNDAANFPDPVDRASQEEEFNLELKTRERERKLIKKIDEALEKIQGGDYGFCAECGAEIGIKRLEARPTAFQCIECKTIAEIREKQTGG
jgi:DnaK suppressor protein